MRMTGKAMLVAAAALGIALTGCTSSSTGGSTGGSPQAGSSGGANTSGGGSNSGSTSGAAASCLVGTWKSTGIDGKLTGNGMNGTLAGGGGVGLTIAADGKTTANFDTMQPVTFTFTVVQQEVKGSFTYGGKVNGTVKTPTDATGTWEPVGTVDFNTLTVTVDIANPAAVRVADKLPLSQFAGTGATDTGNAVDAQPILKKSAYKCSDNRLELSPPAGTPGVGTWVWTKA
jgi:hypothetical protein